MAVPQRFAPNGPNPREPLCLALEPLTLACVQGQLKSKSTSTLACFLCCKPLPPCHSGTLFLPMAELVPSFVWHGAFMSWSRRVRQRDWAHTPSS